MKFFVDTADIDEIRALAETGMLDGVTTNPSLIAKTGGRMLDVIAEICRIVPGPVSAEVAATDYAGMLAEGRRLARIASNVAVKVPLTVDGLRACRELTGEGTPVNVTLCFTPQQAILAAKAGASFVSPFVGRLDDLAHDGMGLIADICAIYRQYDAFTTEVLVASIRHPLHLVDAAKLGAHVATLPPQVIRQLYQHPLTDKGLDAFLADWRKTGQSILDDAAGESEAAE
jgi:transaldolase